MGIGLSNGAFYESDFHYQAGIMVPPPTPDDNEVTPDVMMRNDTVNSDPANITNDQGSIVDYDLSLGQNLMK